MRRIALAIALVAVLIAPAFAQKAEIEAVNAKWIDFFNKGDFGGVASLYAEDATAFSRRAQQPAMPVIGFLNGTSPQGYGLFLLAFRQGLSETGYIEDHN